MVHVKPEGGMMADTMSKQYEKVAITGTEVVGSYTWLNAQEPTIAVPGLPAKWSPPNHSMPVKPDTGTWILDHNLYYFPHSPMEPAIYATLHLHPQFDFSKLDLISDKQPLALLLNLPYAKESGRPLKQHGRTGLVKFEAQVVGDTVIFTRGDGKDTTRGQEGFGGFRRGFDKQHLTQPAGVEDGEGHYGLTSYNLGDLKIMIRHSIDASMPPTAQAPGEPSSSASKTTIDALTVQTAGTLLQPEAIAEINTFINKKSFRRTDKQREAWLSQCGNFIIAEYNEVTPYGAVPASDGFSHRLAEFPSGRIEHTKCEEPSITVSKRYYDYVSSIVQNVREAAVDSEKQLFTVTFGSEGGEPAVSPRSNGPALHDELCERMKDIAKGT